MIAVCFLLVNLMLISIITDIPKADWKFCFCMVFTFLGNVLLIIQIGDVFSIEGLNVLISCGNMFYAILKGRFKNN